MSENGESNVSDRDTYWRLDQIRLRGESVLRYVTLGDIERASKEALVMVLRMIRDELNDREMSAEERSGWFGEPREPKSVLDIDDGTGGDS